MNKLINPSSGQPVMRVLEFDTLNGGKVSIPEFTIQSVHQILLKIYLSGEKTPERDPDGNVLQECINQKYCEVETLGRIYTVRCNYEELCRLLYRGK